ncbi:MAG: Flp pilus assembly protein CpaB [Hyphomicrobiales bacterium]|nr:Flp pilus assembly protein CpaB [Hyphomicrobiales bacterium]MCP5371606.1 Flp pilus assembly protein CpaB [Hyphomicrobiales bacterium]
MNLRTILLLLVAVSAAGLTAFFAKNWLSSERAAMLASMPAKKEVQQTQAVMVLVADSALLPGTFVKASHLRWQAWPEDGVIDSYFVKGKRSEKDFEGAVVRTAVAVGQPITDALVVHPGERGFLAAVLEPGFRAVSVPVNATSGIAGFVFPGDSVDVILTMRVTEKGNKEKEEDAVTRYFSETLLEDVRVLAIDQKVENAEGEAKVAKTATLEVDMKQAEKIAIGLEMGNLSLSLRALARDEEGQGGVEVADAEGTAPLPKGKMKPAARPKPPLQKSYTADMDVYYMLGKPRGFSLDGRGTGVHVIHGSQAEEQKF